ncbi:MULTISPECIES: VOC family protein [unclassified Streptomyces]|uniref:VOC family protein n=1 Tax=unclassified Streptomyces TaxID=2593676 RepID=UPI0036ECE57B
MPEVSAPYAPGTPCWVDLEVPDLNKALDFYQDLFGWQVEPSPRSGGYTCTLRGKPVAGITATMRQEGGPPRWLTCFAVADADDALQAVETHGGTVLTRTTDLLTSGRTAVAADPTGATFGLWQAGDFIGARVVNEPGSVLWNELNTPDPDKAGGFYNAALGPTVAPLEGSPGYSLLMVGSRLVAGLQKLEDPQDGALAHWLTLFAVEDADSTADAAVRAGATVLRKPFDMIVGRMAVLRDPQGAVFAVIKQSPIEV